MILGRPVNLVLGATTAIINLLFLLAAQAGVTFTIEVVAGVNLVANAIVALIANQPPTLNTGDTFKVATPAGQPSEVRTA